MSRPQKTYVTDMFDGSRDKKDAGTPARRWPGLLAGTLVLGLAGGGAAILASGPEARRPDAANDDAFSTTLDTDVTADASAIAPDAPVQELGVGEEGDWRRGMQTRFVMDSSASKPQIEIAASDFKPGRYHYDGDLVIRGDLNRSNLEITANSITVTGSLTADNVRLTGIERGPERSNMQPMFLANDTYMVVTGWKHTYERGDVSIGGPVNGDNISIVAGKISVAGNVSGTVTLSASKGEEADVVLKSQYWDMHRDISEWRDGLIPADHYRETVRWPSAKPEEAISIRGSHGPDVILQSTRDWTRQQEQAAAAARAAARPSLAR
jgi:hypothetical protein